jgi:hypothetical protein
MRAGGSDCVDFGEDRACHRNKASDGVYEDDRALA